MIQGSKTTDLGTVNGTLLSWQEMSQLMEPQNEHTHTHMHTHTHTPQHTKDLLPDQNDLDTSETLCSASSSWATQTRPSRRVRNTTFIFRLSWTFSCQGCGRPSGCRGWGLCHFLKHPYVAVTSHGPMVAPAKTRVTEK